MFQVGIRGFMKAARDFHVVAVDGSPGLSVGSRWLPGILGAFNWSLGMEGSSEVYRGAFNFFERFFKGAIGC